jgi:hypothetical protein
MNGTGDMGAERQALGLGTAGRFAKALVDHVTDCHFQQRVKVKQHLMPLVRGLVKMETIREE